MSILQRMRVPLAASVVIVISLAGCGGSASNAGAADGATTAAVVGKTAPAWTLPLADGGTLRSTSLKGKPIYLNFFATWCGPCQQEAPYIDALSRQFAKKGIVVIGVDELETSRKAMTFKSQHKLTYRIVNDGGVLRDAYSINGLPDHAFISRDGTLKQLRAGEMSKPEIEAALKSLLSS